MSRTVSILLGALALLALGVGGILLFLVVRPPAAPPVARPAAAAVFVPPYDHEAIGLPAVGHPMITHVAIADLDQDGLPDILVCDAAANRVGWIRQYPRGTYTERFIGDPVPGPAHVSVCDLNGDGRPDLLVAGMGVILPNNDRIGQVVVLENLGNGEFRNHVVEDHTFRVTDVRGVDLNGDGRIDLVVGQYGYEQGQLQWLENLGDWKFRGHVLLSQPGTIMTPVADFDGDGRPDFAALLSQDTAQVYGQVHVFTNLGHGQFGDHAVWQTSDLAYGCSGLAVADLNRDGRPDLLLSNGDGFNSAFAAPAPWHGLQWLENRGGGNFVYHRIGDSPGCYSPVCTDLDGDGHPDIVTVSGFNSANDESATWMTAWMNDGREHFTPVPLTHELTWLITVAAGDLDGNGVPVLVTGGFHAYPPYLNASRVTLWRRRPVKP